VEKPGSRNRRAGSAPTTGTLKGAPYNELGVVCRRSDAGCHTIYVLCITIMIVQCKLYILYLPIAPVERWHLGRWALRVTATVTDRFDLEHGTMLGTKKTRVNLHPATACHSMDPCLTPRPTKETKSVSYSVNSSRVGGTCRSRLTRSLGLRQ
jgi:hypothetical protein